MLRLKGVDYSLLRRMSAHRFVRFLNAAIEDRREQRLYQLWIVDAPKMKDPLTFEEYLERESVVAEETQMTNEEIMAYADDIERRAKKQRQVK